MRAGDFVGVETLAARVPFVFPVDGGLLVVGRGTRDAAHPYLLEGFGLGRHGCDQEAKRSEPYTQNSAAILCHHSTHFWADGPVMVNAWVTNLALAWQN